MRPNGTIDSTCLQSREVWTGTTYALAATMIHTYYESTIKNNCKDDSLPSDAIITSNSLVTNQLKIDNELSLLEMAFETAEGIHFAGNFIYLLFSIFFNFFVLFCLLIF